ncbi:MAG: alginate lyase family protein [Anaerolineae bacterium]|nr:alginate lyase family protein [Anaerolineae bacterium]
MSPESTTGPRLSDADFFAKIDTTRPGLEGIPAAVAQGNFVTARHLFAAEVRHTLQPERFFRISRDFRGANWMRTDETPRTAARRILHGELISCSTPYTFEGEVDWFANPTFNQYKEWTWQLSRHPEWALLGERYRETQDEKYAEAFVRYFTGWVHQALVPEDAPGGATLCWRTIEAGIRMAGSWQWALHSFYISPHFTDDVLVDWYKSVWEHGWRLRNFHRTGNWLIMEMNGLAQIGILYPQFKEAPAWKTYAFERMIEELDIQVYPDGFQCELTTGYHQVVIRNYQWLIDVCNAYKVPVPSAFRDGMERMHTTNVMMMMPDGRLPDVNDGSWGEVAPLLVQAVDAYPERDDFRWVYTRGAEGHPPAITSHLFPYAGYAIMRTGWRPDAIWALFDGGPFGYGHQHEDKLHFLLHAYGRLLLTEGGNYAYDDSEMRRYVLSTQAHNTIRVDEQDQNRRRHYRRENFDIHARAGVEWQTTDTYDIAAAAYDEGYGPEAARVVTHHRKIIFLKQGPALLDPCFLVIDRLTPTDQAPHHYQAIWHLNAHAVEKNSARVHSFDCDRPNLTVITPHLPGLSLTLVSGQKTPEWQGWKAIKNHQQGEYTPTPTALFAWETQGPVRLVTLLYPTRPGQTCPVTHIHASPAISATDIQFILAEGDIIKIDEEKLEMRD